MSEGENGACTTGRCAKASREWRARNMRHDQVSLMSWLKEKKRNFRAGRMRIVLNSHRSDKKKCSTFHVHLLCFCPILCLLHKCCMC